MTKLGISNDTCDKNFVTKANLRLHISGVHQKFKNFKCVKCAKAFALKGYLKIHMLNVHGKEKKTSM